MLAAVQTQDHWIKCLSGNGTIRAVAMECTNLAQYACGIHSLKSEASEGFAQSLVGGLLLASYCDDGERINLNIKANGRYGQTIVDAYPDGKVRGCPRPRNETSSQDLSQFLKGLEGDETLTEKWGPWGGGILSVLRTKKDGGEPYIGTVPMVTGHLAKDLTFYLLQSEQTPSSMGIQILFDPNKDKLAHVGGFLIQALPGATDRDLKEVEKRILEQTDSAAWKTTPLSPIALMTTLLQDQGFTKLSEESLSYWCGCNLERVEKAIVLTGREEIATMAKESEPVIVRCDFCSKEYQVDQSRIGEILKGLVG